MGGVGPRRQHALKAGQLAEWRVQVLNPAGPFPGLAPLQPPQMTGRCQVNSLNPSQKITCRDCMQPPKTRPLSWV